MTSSKLFDSSGLDLPPGPERRATLRAAGFNVSTDDCTPEELAAFKAEMDAVVDAPWSG